LSRKIAALFIALTALIVSSFVFILNWDISVSTLILAFQIILPASLVMGFLGFLVGRVLESSKTDDVVIFENNARQSYVDDILVSPKDLVKTSEIDYTEEESVKEKKL